MTSFIILIMVAVFSFIICSIVLGALNQSMLRLFVPIQRLTGNLKRKNLYGNLTLIALIAISAVVRNYLKLGDVNFGVLLGFFFALENIFFSKSIAENK